MAGWRKIPGVDSIGYGMSHRGFFPEIQIWVKDTKKIPSVRAKVPASIDGIAVAVVPPLRGTYGRPSSVKCPEQGARYLRAVKENMQAWSRIPGVLGISGHPDAIPIAATSTDLECRRRFHSSNR
jgi:hypothetical protein